VAGGADVYENRRYESLQGQLKEKTAADVSCRFAWRLIALGRNQLWI